MFSSSSDSSFYGSASALAAKYNIDVSDSEDEAPVENRHSQADESHPSEVHHNEDSTSEIAGKYLTVLVLPLIYIWHTQLFSTNIKEHQTLWNYAKCLRQSLTIAKTLETQINSATY